MTSHLGKVGQDKMPGGLGPGYVFSSTRYNILQYAPDQSSFAHSTRCRGPKLDLSPANKLFDVRHGPSGNVKAMPKVNETPASNKDYRSGFRDERQQHKPVEKGSDAKKKQTKQ